MKIRTITVGFPFHPSMTFEEFSILAKTLKKIKKTFEDNGYIVQTIRMSTQPLSDMCSTKTSLLSMINNIDEWMAQHHIDYWNSGPITKKEHIQWVPEILQTAKTVFCTANICDTTTIYYESIKQTAKTILANSMLESQGFANLRFAALCNISSNTPFFPASYHGHTRPSFSIGLENSDLVYAAFSKAETLPDAQHHLQHVLLESYQPIENIAMTLSKKFNISYDGIDTSISTSIKKDESIAYACEHLFESYQFGSPGTLTCAKIITDALQSLPIKNIGYNGLMLPVLEDHGLATRNTENRFNLSHLLFYSAVCGTGLDTIPLPGNTTQQDLERILMDVATLSIKLQKPLSARLMPIPGKKPGDMTEFSFPYFKNSSVMNPR